MFSKKIRLKNRGKSISVATALVLLAIDEILEQEEQNNWVYGYVIMNHLRESYNWENVKSGTIYPILKKLEQRNFIRRGVGPDLKRESKRQTIYYKLTKLGEKLAEELKSLNDETLDKALSSSEEDSKGNVSFLDLSKFPKRNFTKNFLMPFLLEYDRLIAKSISADLKSDRIEELLSEIKLSITELEDFTSLLKVHISKLEKIKDLNP